MFASGPVDFNSNDFTLAVTGGTGGYIGNRGQVVQRSVAQAAAKSVLRLDFSFG